MYVVITAVRRALGKVVIVIDCEYVFKGVNSWTHKCQKQGWLAPQGPVENTDLWVELLPVLEECTATIEWLWSPYHTGIEGNEEADRPADQGRLMPPLYDKCCPGSVARPLDVDLLYPTPTRVGRPTMGNTPVPRTGTRTGRPAAQPSDLTAEPSRAHHQMGLGTPPQPRAPRLPTANWQTCNAPPRGTP